MPLLPYRCGGKLLFPLCKSCAETENQQECDHSDAERALSGTWVTCELEKALSLGYKINEIYEVWHYPATTQYNKETGEGGLFADSLRRRQLCWPAGPRM